MNNFDNFKEKLDLNQFVKLFDSQDCSCCPAYNYCNDDDYDFTSCELTITEWGNAEVNNYIELSEVNKDGEPIGYIDLNKNDIDMFYGVGHTDSGVEYTRVYLKNDQCILISEKPYELDELLGEA